MILMEGEKTGMTMPGCFDIQVSAYEDEPNVVHVYAEQLMLGSMEKTMGIWHYRYTGVGEDASTMVVPCTPEEYEVALQCDRFFMITPDTDNSGELPPLLRKYGEQMVAGLRAHVGG